MPDKQSGLVDKRRMTGSRHQFDGRASDERRVLGYDYVGCAAGVAMHRVRYQCPVSGNRYNFVTSLPYMSPGLIAYLYKVRWDIEKIFDQVKNKLTEKKSWETTETAKTMQAQFICLAHNLMLILERYLQQKGIENKKENNRRQARLETALSSSSGLNKARLPSFFLKRPGRPHNGR